MCLDARLDLTWLDPDFIFQLLRFVPVAGVGSRRLIFLIPDLQAVADLIQDEDRTTCPYHLRPLERKAAVTSCIPSLAHNKSLEISSCGLTPKIHRIINLSFRRSRCKSGAVGALVYICINRYFYLWILHLHTKLIKLGLRRFDMFWIGYVLIGIFSKCRHV